MGSQVCDAHQYEYLHHYTKVMYRGTSTMRSMTTDKPQLFRTEVEMAIADIIIWLPYLTECILFIFALLCCLHEPQEQCALRRRCVLCG